MTLRAIRWIVVSLFVVLLVEFPRHYITMIPDIMWSPAQYDEHMMAVRNSFFRWSYFSHNLSELFHRLTTFSLGINGVDDRPIIHDVVSSFGSTLILLTIGLLFVIVFGVAKGIYDGLHKEANIMTTASNSFQWLAESLPDVSIILTLQILGFFLNRHGLNVYFVGSHQFIYGTVVPALVLSLLPMMYISRVARRVIEEQYGQQYLVTARAKGLSRPRVLVRHVIPNIIPAIVQATVPAIAMLFANLVIVEYLFYRNGVVSGLLNAMDFNNFLPGQGQMPLPSRPPDAAQEFFPSAVLSYIAACVFLFIICWIVIKVSLRIMGYRGNTMVSPYTDILREKAWKMRIPWSLQLGGSILIIMTLIGLFQQHLSLPDPNVRHVIGTMNGEIATPPFPPSGHYLLGTDYLGRDLLSMSIQGIVPTYGYVAGTALFLVALGLIFGILSSTFRFAGFRAFVETWNTLFSFIPGVVMALLILEIPSVYFMGGTHGQVSFGHEVAFLGTLCLIEGGRIVFNFQSFIDELEHKSFMEAADISGNSKLTKLIIHHSRPLLNFISEQFVIAFSRVLLLMVTLGFFGLALTMKWENDGFDRFIVDNVPHDWGGLIALNSRYYLGVPWVFFAPILCVTITIIALNLMLTGIRRMSQTMPHNTKVRRRSALDVVGRVMVSRRGTVRKISD